MLGLILASVSILQIVAIRKTNKILLIRKLARALLPAPHRRAPARSVSPYSVAPVAHLAPYIGGHVAGNHRGGAPLVGMTRHLVASSSHSSTPSLTRALFSLSLHRAPPLCHLSISPSGHLTVARTRSAQPIDVLHSPLPPPLDLMANGEVSSPD